MSNANAPAFPTAPFNTVGSGLTKREYFAAMFIQAWLSSPNLSATATKQQVAIEAIKQADTLIEELSK